jgi:hypothetical protein
MKQFLLLLSILFNIIYSALSYGYVATVFSKWFIKPIFSSIPDISILQYAGIMYFIHLFNNHDTTVYEDHKTDFNETFAKILIRPWVILLSGWIIYNLI